MVTTSMRSFDVFAGVGGISHGLRGLGIEPVMYCERDPMAVAVLRQRMRAGDLPPAPVYTDVATFPGKKYRGDIDMITAGFPCLGFSTAGSREGFNHPGTGLYKHIVRLVNEIQPRVVFLENVAAIRNAGLQHVAETLRARGYDVSWVSLRGIDVGSPQHRYRWFCLATASGFAKTLTASKTFTRFPWAREPPGVPRMLTGDKGLAAERHALLGNTVIPDVVRYAFLYLWTGSRVADVFRATSWTLAPPALADARPTTVPPAHGMASGKNTVAALPLVATLAKPPQRRIVLDPKAYTSQAPRNAAQKHPALDAAVEMTIWATPRHGMTGSCRVLTARSQRDLETQLRFAVGTPHAARGGHANPEWIEWLMGFPRGWTTPNPSKS